MPIPALPKTPIGLYDPFYEKAACGVGFSATLRGEDTRVVLEDARMIVERLCHRGGCSYDNKSGDGAGILTSIPHSFYKEILKTASIKLPEFGEYGTGIIFVDKDDAKRTKCQNLINDLCQSMNLTVIYWRVVPVVSEVIGEFAATSEPTFLQLFVTYTDASSHQPVDLQKQLYLLRKQISHKVASNELRCFPCSLSTSQVVYKGLLNPLQLFSYFPDLCDERFKARYAIAHCRYSTNTLPSWERAHPQRLLCHNGEINTLRGNVNLMHAREGTMASDRFSQSELIDMIYPIIEPGQSDSGCFDNALEFLVEAGNRSVYEALLLMIPEAWQNDAYMDQERKNMFKFNSFSMEPWDGPALISFADGQHVGSILDRNGLRPARYYEMEDRVIMSSEVGVVDIAPEDIVKKGRVKPGHILLIDTKCGEVMVDAVVKSKLAKLYPYAEWLKKSPRIIPPKKEDVLLNSTLQLDMNAINSIHDFFREEPRLHCFFFSLETFEMLLFPMIINQKEALGSMGNDAALGCLSNVNPLFFDYFKQLFAQVTNPPVDPIRESFVMSLECPIGPASNILKVNEKLCERVILENPILTTDVYTSFATDSTPGFRHVMIDMTFPISSKPESLEEKLDSICKLCIEKVKSGINVIILTDEPTIETRVPMGCILVLGAVHHSLIEAKLRLQVAIIVVSGEPKEVHHHCVLLGFGADAIYPYFLYKILKVMNAKSLLPSKVLNEDIELNYQKACSFGIRKVMAKMGISMLQSYKGAQIFEAIGLHNKVVEKCFKGTSSRIGGCDFKTLGEYAIDRHNKAFFIQQKTMSIPQEPGIYHWRRGAEQHINTPEIVAHLQDASKSNSIKAYKSFVNATEQQVREVTLRGQFILKEQKPIDIENVEAAKEIVKRFSTGAMSLGSISAETHSTLAKAMNQIDGRSNSGEGGEVEERYINPKTRSAIKQIASGRFGVTSAYVAHADVLQIKMAQGAKPGEGGELPGYKVSVEIATNRHSMPGVGLISPPPHHDIYSIEDLAQLIYDLRSANPNAIVSVKLVSCVGVGVVASGVAKGGAGLITISGHDGGTGASSWTGIKHAGVPWELGLSETHQVLLMNNMRSNVILQVDGQIRTGKDIIIATFLGAEEFAFSTAPLITLGCIMMRKCHLNTCPVGIATQDPELRAKFTGQPEHLLNYLFLLAEEVRGYLSQLGFTKLQEAVGRFDLLETSLSKRALKSELLLTNIISNKLAAYRNPVKIKPSAYSHTTRLDYKIYLDCLNLIENSESHFEYNGKIQNTDRTFGATLSYYISLKYKDSGLPANKSININLKGSAGQSFGAFLCKGVKLVLQGDANDYVGKSLSGGEIVIFPPMDSKFDSVKNIIVGNACLYGAIKGKAFFRGQAAERFCVRNSGAVVIAEGCGDHGCEYMTGGEVILLGKTGRNFAAGMSGGLAFVFDPENDLPGKCQMDSIDIESPDENDFTRIRSLLEEYVSSTFSTIAEEITSNWSTSKSCFRKIFPKEYKRILRNPDVVQQSTPTKVINEVDLEDLAKPLKLDKLRGFKKYPRVTKNYISAKTRLENYDEIYNKENIMSKIDVQAARCMDCGIPFCHSEYGCPLGNIIPKFNSLALSNQWKEALEQLLHTNEFPEITGRVCPAPCEGACVLGITERPVNIKNIEYTIAEKGFSNGWIKPIIPPLRTKKHIAIVGSGPAGLSAASFLNRKGHTVVVYERNSLIGGLLAVGIPNMKLSKVVLQRRLDIMSSEGIIFKPNVEVGKTITCKELVSSNDAVLLCTGAAVPRDLKVPGRELNGIFFAGEFLENAVKHRIQKSLITHADGKHVIVIGGGDTGADCTATSLRQTAKSVRAFEILPEPPVLRAADNPWPQWPRIMREEYAHEEGKELNKKDPRTFSILTKEFLGENGCVTGIRVVKIQWEKDENGRWQMKEIPETEETLPCDMALLAIGFLGPEHTIVNELCLDVLPNTNIKTPNNKYNTSSDTVFAAGDCRRGQSLVVWAISEGRRAAQQIHNSLMNV